MKKLIFLLIIFATVSNSMPIDTNVFKYMPMQVGNMWKWDIEQWINPGPGRESETIIDTQVFNNHMYYKMKHVTYYPYGNQYYNYFVYYRIDSLTGNFYTFDTYYNRECLIDSLNSSVGDSAHVGCSSGPERWDIYGTGTYNIFGQNFNSKNFGWSNYFEAGGNKAFAFNLGKVLDQYGTVHYTITRSLRGCIINGIMHGDTNMYLAVNPISTETPEKFSLLQNYPNPFNPATNIKFQIPKIGFVKLTIFDALGKEVQTLVNEQLSPGTFEADFDGSNLPSGVYYYKLVVGDNTNNGDFTETKKMVLIK